MISSIILLVTLFEVGFFVWYFLVFVIMWRGSATQDGRDPVAAWFSLANLFRSGMIMLRIFFLLFVIDLETYLLIPERFLLFLIFQVALSIYKAFAITLLTWHLKFKHLWAKAKSEE